jgi:hypothetical protein
MCEYFCNGLISVIHMMNFLICAFYFNFSLLFLWFRAWPIGGPPCLGPVQHGPKGIRAWPGLLLRWSDTTQHGTEGHRACIVPGLVGPGQIRLGSGGPFGHPSIISSVTHFYPRMELQIDELEEEVTWSPTEEM